MRNLLRSFGLLILFPAAAWAGPDVDLQAMRTEPAPGTGTYTAPFWPDGTYRSDVRSPSEFLGYPIGSVPAPHADIVRYFEYLDQLPTAELHTYAQSYEGRTLVYLVIASEQNAARLSEIKADCQKLADPRTLGGAKPSDIVARTPAVAWMAYGIHGDELSSCDAALELAYQLTAGTDAATRRILDNCVVVIDPTENPDGRTRWLTQLAQWNGVITSHDVQSMSHTGLWPYGRTNHYLFDLNRDWFALVHPETRGRTAAILDWMPHYLLDCHEMGPLDTYLFSPPREPFNPHMVGYIHKWWEKVAKEHAAQFDRFGWSYYTREWNEELYPGYGSSWAIYLGAVGFLFEQAGVDGSQIKRPDGTVMTYRETVHHQFVGSMANLTAVADGRAELLNDYHRQKVDNLRAKPRTFVFAAGGNRTRLDRFVEKLQHQHIEVERTTQGMKLSRARAWDGTEARDVTIPAGSALVRTNQPMKQLAEAILEFDIRIPTSFLKTEKKDILARGDSRLYDTTGWSLPLAYGLDAYVVDGAPRVDSEAYAIAAPAGSVSNDAAKVGFAFDGRDDRALELVARLFENQIRVWCAQKPFRAGETVMPRGSFLVRRAGNPGLDVTKLRALAEAAGVVVIGVDGGLASGAYADLGGNEFSLLVAPRIALVAGTGTNSTSFGATWHLLDSRFRVRTSIVDVTRVADTDLSKYNVIVLPDYSGGVEAYRGVLRKSGIENLKTWVEAGGTLVADGAGAAMLADTSVAIASVRMRDQVLKDLPDYVASLALAKSAFSPVVDSLSLWGPGAAKKPAQAEEKKDEKESGDLESRKREDEVARKLAPRGAIVAVDLDEEHWLAFGCPKTIPALLNTNRTFVTKATQVPARLAPADRLRLSGLFWEEARARWSESVYAARDAVGSGQVIVFVSTPNFRGYFHGAERLLLNALLLGPGCGTSQRVEW
ncbi:MAG TPA: M14 family metallopeptidase [Candidatus Krumholzibacteria bacterium]|nr:M14 family metallopeptidase [Candidatus Krumholzibacteria bacterium]